MNSQSSLVADFRAQAAHRPNAPAVLWQGRQVTYAELLGLVRAARPAVDAAARGPLGILAVKSPGAIALVLACLEAGRSFLLPSPALPRADLDALFARAGCVQVLTVDEDGAPAPRDPLMAGPYVHAGADQDEDPEWAISFMLTTSGSTGLPKVVPLTVAAVDRFTDWAHRRFDLGPGRTVLNYAPLNFDLCMLDVWATLRHGGRVVLVDAQSATRGSVLRELIAEHKVNVVQAVPLLYELLRSESSGNGARLDSVRHVVTTGEAISRGCLAALPELFPWARIYNLYGCTETNDSFLYEITSPEDPPARLPLGQPLPGVRARLVDEDGLVLRGPGVGELHVSTPFQTPGYLGGGPQARSKFVQDPPDDGGAVYFRSGDLVERAADGTLTLVGRNDFQVKVRGQRINTQEVERVLLAHEHVLEAAVVALPDPQGGNRLHGVVRSRPGDGLSTLHLRRHCAERLLAAAVPSSLRITAEPLPLTSTGKTDRNRIRRSVMEGN